MSDAVFCQPKNIIEVDGEWKLIDLDASARFGTDAKVSEGSTGYAPPEAARRLFGETTADLGRLRAAAQFDMWSFGVLLFELCSGVQLFRKDINDNLEPNEFSRLLLWLDVSKDELARVFPGAAAAGMEAAATAAKDLIRACLSGDPQRRPTCEQVLGHVFLTGVWGDQPTDAATTVRPMRYHFFISHMQKEASGEVGLLFHQFEGMGVHCWRDMVRTRPYQSQFDDHATRKCHCRTALFSPCAPGQPCCSALLCRRMQMTSQRKGCAKGCTTRTCFCSSSPTAC